MSEGNLDITSAIPEKLLQFGIEQTIKPVIELAQRCTSREEFINKLSLQYPKMETAELEELLVKAILISELQGMTDTQNESFSNG